jgi:hypothetical protein
MRDQRSGDLFNRFCPRVSRMMSFLGDSVPRARSAGLAPLVLLTAFVGVLLLPATGSGAGRGGPAASLRLPLCGKTGNKMQTRGCTGGAVPGMGGLAGWWRGRELRGGQGANETQEGEGLNATAENSSQGSSPRFIQAGACGIIMRQPSSDQLSPRCVALFQQREREGACEDGVGSDWSLRKTSALTRASVSFFSMEDASTLRDIQAGEPTAAAAAAAAATMIIRVRIRIITTMKCIIYHCI